MSDPENDPKEDEEVPTNETDVPEEKDEASPEPVSTKIHTKRELRRQALIKRSNELRPKLLKLYKHKGFPRTGVQALTVDRVLLNLGLDEKDDLNRRAVGFAWHKLYDEKKVAVPQFWRPPDDNADKLPF